MDAVVRVVRGPRLRTAETQESRIGPASGVSFELLRSRTPPSRRAGGTVADHPCRIPSAPSSLAEGSESHGGGRASRGQRPRRRTARPTFATASSRLDHTNPSVKARGSPHRRRSFPPPSRARRSGPSEYHVLSHSV